MIKPILFNTDMVRAIMDGRKTVTRRVMKPQPVMDADRMWQWKDCQWMDGGLGFPASGIEDYAPCCPGDILYVRETWTVWNGNYEYKADVDSGYGPFCSNCTIDICTGGCNSIIKWRPSIHMPREAARIFLRVTDVKVERLQNIGDCTKEGITPGRHETAHMNDYDERCDFKFLWDSTIKPEDRALYGWEANPWVFVIGFERIDREEA